MKSPEQNSMEERTLAATTGMVSPTDTETPEQNSRIEPGLAAQHDGGPGEEISAGTGDGDNSDFLEEIDRQKSLEWIRAGSARMAEIRAEMLRKLNEKSRREAKEGNTGRSSRRERNENGNPPDRPQTQAEGIDPRTEGTNPGRTIGDSAELVNAGSAVTVRAGPT